MQHISFKRMMAMLLALVIVVGLLPVSVLAAEGTATGEFSGGKVINDTAVIFSDLHTSSSNYKESTVKNIMGALAGLPVSSVTSAGDAFSVNEDNSSSNGPYTGKTSVLNGYINDVFSGIDINYTWSDHDRYALQEDDKTLLDKTSHLSYGAGNDGIYGTNDDGNYYVYTLSMADLCSYDRYNAGFAYTESNNSNRVNKGFTATVQLAIEQFLADAEKLHKDRPLFIISHQPLFDNRNDNAWAEDWCDAINEVAKDMDVAYFYGHNHKYDSGSDYYYAKGSTMPVATRDKWGWDYDISTGYLPSMDLSSENKVINFTHMCAGYLAPATSSTTTRQSTVLAVTVTNSKLQFTTYDSNGVYTGNYAVNVTIDRDHANADIPKSVAVTGKTDYQVGNGIQAPSSVKVTYMNGSVQTLESGYALTKITDSQGQNYTVNGFTFPKEGTYQLTYTCTVGSYQAQAILTVEAKGEAAPPVTLEDAATGISVTAPGLSRLNVSNVTDRNVLGAVSLKLTGNVKAYDIQVGGFTSGTATVTMPIPEGVTRPAVYYVSDNGAIVERMPITATTETTITFTTTHFSTYVVGEDTEITVPNPTPAIATGTATTTTTKTVYVLVSSLTAGNQYIIVNRNTSGNGYALEENTTTGTSITVNAAGNGISNPYIETTDEALMWNATSGLKLQSENGDYYLRYNNGLGFSTSRSTDWSYSNNSLTYRSGRNSYYLTCSNRGSWSASTSSSSVYFYEKQTIEVETEATVEGKYEVTLTPEQAEIKQVVTNGSTVALSSESSFA